MGSAASGDGKTSNVKSEAEYQQKEWEIAREVLKNYDERLHDIRKYGFSFVTALLTIDAFVTKTIVDKTITDVEATSKITVAGLFNLGIFVVTLMLVVALHLLDRNYQVFSHAAYTRAKVIERKLNLEISEIIGARHRQHKINQHVFYVYVIFTSAIALLGYTVLSPSWPLRGILFACVLIAGLYMYCQLRELRIRFVNKDLWEDWTVSPLELNKNEEIRITLNNLSEEYAINPITRAWFALIGKKASTKAIEFKKDKKSDGLIWVMKDEYGNSVYTRSVCKDEKGQLLKDEEFRPLTVYDNHVWVVKPIRFIDEGKARVYKLWPRGWSTPLPVSIIVTENDEKVTDLFPIIVRRLV